MIWLPLLGLSLASLSDTPECSGAVASQAHIQWKTPSKWVSPDRRWELEVAVDWNDDSGTKVKLRSCPEKRVRTLFSFARDANIFWGPESKNLLVINEPWAETSEVLLFETQAPRGTEERSSMTNLDKAIRQRVLRSLSSGRMIQFYRAQLVVWEPQKLVVSVGVTSTAGELGRMSTSCFAFSLTTSPVGITRQLSSADLSREFGKECR